LKELIDAKIAGQEVIAPPQTEEEVPIIKSDGRLTPKRAEKQAIGQSETSPQSLNLPPRGGRPIAPAPP
jgi:hypothetical protein